MQEIVYTVGVRRRFGLGVTEYRVTAHRLEVVGNRAHLVLTLTDRSEVHLPDIGSKAWRVYPDYQAEKQRVAEIETEINQKAQAGARALVQQQQAEQIAAMNAQRRMQAVNGTMGQVPIQG